MSHNKNIADEDCQYMSHKNIADEDHQYISDEDEYANVSENNPALTMEEYEMTTAIICDVLKKFKQYAYDNGLPLFENMTFNDLDEFMSN